MTFEYSGDPSTSSKDAVRFLMQDTNDEDVLLQDEEIDWLLTQHGDVGAAAVAGLTTLANRYASMAIAEKEVGDLRIKYADRSAALRAQAEQVSNSVVTVAPVPVMTGSTFSGRESARSDLDRVPDVFEVGMHDNDSEPRDPQDR